VNGNILKNESTTTNLSDLKITVADLPAGVYLLKLIIDNKGIEKILKFIVNE
jgi:hypothetical protein